MGGRPSTWTVVKFAAVLAISFPLNAARLVAGWVKRMVTR